MKTEIKNQIFEGKSNEERLQLLADNCKSKEVQLVKIYFSEDDLAEMKSRLSERSIEKDALEDELKELSKDLRSKIKIESVGIKGLLTHLKNKFEEQSQEVFNFDDQENGVMLTYNNQGELIGSRKLRPNERQTSILNLHKTA